jgi:G patch domain-containing protein 1
MGVKLLQKMGWRQGQGVGPKVRRKARADEDGEDEQEHLFAPENSSMIKFVKKSDFKGLGYAGELSLPRAIEDVKPEQEDEDDSTAAWSRDKFKAPKKKPKKIKPSFGVGILNDTGSDDEDPYELGPKISYSRTIGGDKENKQKPTVVKGANPLLASKPIFTSKKNPPSKPGFRKCHDGRLPLNGFVLAMQNLDLAQQARYPPPNIPDDWHGKRSRWDVKPADEFKSTSESACRCTRRRSTTGKKHIRLHLPRRTG